MRFTKKLTSVVLALCLLLSAATVGVVTASAEDAAYETYAQASIRGSNILHCFNWSYNQIKANLSDIAKAGYTAVQTSPVQSPKDYNSSWTDTSEQWWKLYQPLGFSVSNNSWLGTKAELTSMCAEADKYGIKVVVDVVANHLANNGTDGGTYSYINSGVESDLKNANYYHTNNTRTNDNNRYNITQYHLGMPDLNTGNSYVQQRALGLLEECIDCGVDGFRFDAAKHIELPTDQSNFRSNFWPTVINGATAYAQEEGKETPFYYGEILGGAGTDISNYTQYMAVTDNYTGDLALDKAYWAYAPDLANGSYHKGASAADSLLWVESHDTYMGDAGSAWTGNTASVENNIINRAWAIVGARAESTALFFARPNSSMGYASTDGNWKSKAVAEVNKFKNHFAGTSEYLASSGDKVAYIERGTKGVVISKLDGGGQVSLTAHQMQDGTYTDYVTGGTFTVSNGVISGNVDSQGVAVVYNAEDSAGNFIEADTLYLDPGISSWKQSGQRYAMFVFNSSSSAWASMADSDSDGIYEAAVPSGNWTGVIFCTMDGSDPTNSWDNKTDQTADLFPTDGNDLFTVTGADSGDSSKFNGAWSVYSPRQEETTEPATEAQEKDTYTIYAVNDAGWSNMSVHYWGGSSTQWPGAPMTSYSGSKVYTFELPKNVSGIVFSNGAASGTKQTGNITTGFKDGAIWVIGSVSQNNYPVSAAPTYYMVGTVNGWSNNDNYAFSICDSDPGKLEYKLSNVQLPANAELKVHSSSDTWYPGGANYTVATTGTYDIYFRPNGDGNSDWYQGYFYLVNMTPCAVTWKNYDGSTIGAETYTYGGTPEYKGETPQKPADEQYSYAFAGWSPEPAAVTGDTVYTAQFTSAAHDWQVGWTWNGCESAEVHFSCADCAMTADRTATVTSVTTEPTMSAGGSVVYTASVTGPDGLTYTDTKTEQLPATAVHLAGHSVSLDGDIAVNFFMLLDSAIANSPTAYMQFTVPDTSPEYQAQQVYVKDLTPVELDGKNYYVFKCRVAAKDMDAQISAQLIDGSDTGDTYTYSVREYAEYLLDNLDVPAYACAESLVRAMLEYGDNAKYYFGSGEKPADCGAVIPEYTAVESQSADCVFDGASLSLKSKTTLSLYFDSASEIAFSVDGADCELEHIGNEYAVRIRNISVCDLDKAVTVKANGAEVLTYCPLVYCYKAQNSSNAKLVGTVKALYDYWLAAKSYFSS